MESCTKKVLDNQEKIVGHCWQIMYDLFNCEEERKAFGGNKTVANGVEENRRLLKAAE